MRTMSSIKVPENLILFITDQERAHNLNYSKGFEDDLPGTSWLKKNGLSFSNSFTNTNQCSVSRATFFTSKFPAQHEVMEVITSDNWPNPQTQAQRGLNPSLPNLATALKKEGYDVVYKGKAHLNIGYNRTMGTADPSDDEYVDPDLSLLGFDEWEPPEAGTFHNPWGIVNTNYLNNSDSEFHENDQRFTNEAIEWIETRQDTNNDKPFALIISLVNPHDILAFPDPRPAPSNQDNKKKCLRLQSGQKCTQSPRGLAKILGYENNDFQNDHFSRLQPIPLTIKDDPTKLYKPDAQANFLDAMDSLFAPMKPRLVRDYLNFYVNLVRRSDEMLDSIIKTVNNEKSFADNTMIVKLSDHGELGLAHGGMRQKTYNAYDEAIKIPTIWSNPKYFKGKSHKSDALISTIDFLPTYLNFIGANQDDIEAMDLRGKDYSSILKGTQKDIQDNILFTWNDDWAGQDPYGLPSENKDPQLGGIQTPSRIHALRSKKFKLVRYYDQSKPYDDQTFQEEFYDLRTHGTDYSKRHGIPLERKNYSPWAENLRIENGDNTISTKLISRQYKKFSKELDQQVKNKLQPLPRMAGVLPTLATRLTADGERVEMMAIHKGPKNRSSELELAFNSRSQQYYRIQILENYLDSNGEAMQTWVTLGGGTIKGTNNPIYMYFKGLPKNLQEDDVRIASVFTPSSDPDEKNLSKPSSLSFSTTGLSGPSTASKMKRRDGDIDSIINHQSIGPKARRAGDDPSPSSEEGSLFSASPNRGTWWMREQDNSELVDVTPSSSMLIDPLA